MPGRHSINGTRLVPIERRRHGGGSAPLAFGALTLASGMGRIAIEGVPSTWSVVHSPKKWQGSGDAE